MKTRTSSRVSEGFTLLELLVVLSLLLLAGTLVIPNLGGTDSRAFEAQMRQVVNTLTYTRRVAIVEGTPKVASFHALDPDSPDYAAQREALNAHSGAPAWITETMELRFQEEMNRDPEAVTEVEVTFFPQGGSTGGVLNFAQNGLSARVRVDPITGRIALATGEEEFGDAY